MIYQGLGFRGRFLLEPVSECSWADFQQFLYGQSYRTTSTRRWSKQHGSEYHGQSLITVWSTRTLWNTHPLPRVLLFTLLLVLFSKHYICRVISSSDCLSHHFLLPIPARRVFNLTLSLSWKQRCRTECRFCGFFFLCFSIHVWLGLLSIGCCC